MIVFNASIDLWRKSKLQNDITYLYVDFTQDTKSKKNNSYLLGALLTKLWFMSNFLCFLNMSVSLDS